MSRRGPPPGSLSGSPCFIIIIIYILLWLWYIMMMMIPVQFVSVRVAKSSNVLLILLYYYYYYYCSARRCNRDWSATDSLHQQALYQNTVRKMTQTAGHRPSDAALSGTAVLRILMNIICIQHITIIDQVKVQILWA